MEQRVVLVCHHSPVVLRRVPQKSRVHFHGQPTRVSLSICAATVRSRRRRPCHAFAAPWESSIIGSCRRKSLAAVFVTRTLRFLVACVWLGGRQVLGVDDVLAFDFLDPPAEDQALEALQHLYCLGALDQDGRATDIGRRMSRFPLEPSLSRTLLEAGELGCLEEILTIVALLSVESIWFTRSKGGGSGPGSGGGRGRHGERDEEAEASHALFRHPLGDHFTYLAVYRAWEANGYSDAWAKEEFLRVRALRTARSVRAQLLGEVKKAAGRDRGAEGRGAGRGVDVTSCGRDLDKARKAFCAGYFMNAGQRCSKEWVYRSLAVGALQKDGSGAGQSGLTLMYLHPTCALVHAPEPPEHVVYTELVFTARPFMRHAMAVKGRWLRSRLESVQACSADRLCGRAVPTEKEKDVSMMSTADGLDGPDVEVTAESAVEQQAKKTGAIAAARARFLARKRAK